MRHDVRLLYLGCSPLCPCPVSVRLPTDSCRQGCFFCCKSSWFGSARLSLRHRLEKKTFLRLFQQIIVEDNFRFVWPQKKIIDSLRKKRVLRFVREDLFESSMPEITSAVLKGCFFRGYGLLVKTSSVNVVNYIEELKKVRHCIVFSVTDLLEDHKKKIKAINKCVLAGLKVSLSLSPIFEFNKRTEYILSSVHKNILGVEVGWLHGVPGLLPAEILRRGDYKYVRWESQYKRQHLEKVVSRIRAVSLRKGLQVRFYFSSVFYQSGACCFVDRV